MELYGSSYVKSYESTYKTKGAGVKIASSMDPAPIAPRNSNIFSEFQFGGMTLYLMITITKKSIFLLDFFAALIWSLGALHDIFLLPATFAQILTLRLLGLGIVACLIPELHNALGCYECRSKLLDLLVLYILPAHFWSLFMMKKSWSFSTLSLCSALAL